MKAPLRRVAQTHGRLRRLLLEPLEERRVLDATAAPEISVDTDAEGSPWQNPGHRLDVNDNGFTSVSDVAAIINRILSEGIGELPEPDPNPPEFFYDTSGDNRLTGLDLLHVINGILTPPEVVVSSLAPFTIDVTPLVTVTATDNDGSNVPDGTIVELDVDLNDDGDFSDPGELSRTQSTIFAGSSTFEITPALDRTGVAYTVKLRARVMDVDAVSGSSDLLPLIVDTGTSDALADYVNAPDDSYTYSVASTDDSQEGYTYYVLQMTSQTWRSEADVDDPVWDHWMGVYVPDNLAFNTALMGIGGGRNTSGPPGNATDFESAALAEIAKASGTVVYELTTVPNEPVTFTDENDDRTEDEIIAYTFDKYMRNIGEPGNETWPLLLPMVKSAVRAMDTIQDFIPDVREGFDIDEFVVTGGSKRGWTTWLTAAVDDRVAAIAPAVIDVLNMGPQMVHHYGAYGFFSEAIHDYQDLQIFERMLTDQGRELGKIVDPYSYLNNGRFDDMPKLILNSAGDEFFVSDSAQYYINDLPGDLNRLRYVPNTGHGLDERAFESLASFYGAYLFNLNVPEYSWTVEQNGEIHVQTSDAPSQVLLWQATTPDRDFRHLKTGDIWTSTVLVDQGGGNYVGDVPMPAAGATAYLVELTFPFPIPGVPAHVFTSEVRVKSTLPFNPWPFGAPEVEVSSLTPFTVDVTPWVTVTASGQPELADGTLVTLDVDLNDDGDFDDAGELGHTQSTLFEGSSTFELATPLERTEVAYAVNLRARVTDSFDQEGISPLLPLGVDTRTSDALENYVNTPDDSYEWSIFSTDTSNDDYTYYVLEMTSQTWRSEADVDDPVWDHWLGVYVPNAAISSTALMAIGGGSNTSGPPSNSPDALGAFAALSGTVVFELTTVPNEPVTFTDENFTRSEDAIIAYTFDKFLENLGQPGNDTWPLLLPMVKSAVRAMDTIQAFVPDVRPGSTVDEFVVFGGSKRGWTTWLTAAVDDRVAAIMPGVIDVLNMGPQMVHHYGAYGFFSAAIQDYVNMNIFERLLSDAGREMGRIVDPYSYLNNGRFDDMPKLIVNSPGDEFFVTDSAQFYINDIPGDQNRLRYIPNTGHGLEETAVFNSIASFYGAYLLNLPLPEYSWTVQQNGEIHVETTAFQAPSQVLLWQATNPVSRDFRNLLTGDIWTSTPLLDQGGGTYVGDVATPASGATAYFVELTFPFPIPGVPAHVFTTEVRVKTDLPLNPWPFDLGNVLPSAVPAATVVHSSAALAEVPTVGIDVRGRDATASALAIQSVAAESPVEAAAIDALSTAADEPTPATVGGAPGSLMLAEAPPDDGSADAETDSEPADSIFASDLAELFA